MGTTQAFLPSAGSSAEELTVLPAPMGTNSRRAGTPRQQAEGPLPDGHGLPGPRSTRITAEPGRALAAALGRDWGSLGRPTHVLRGTWFV